MIKSPVAKSLYNFVELDVSEIGNYPEGIIDICDRQVHGLIVKNFLSPEDISRVVSRLTRKDPFPGSPFGDVLIYGPALYICDADITQYCEEAVDFRKYCRQLFSGGADFETRLTEVLGAMSGGRPVELPVTPDGYAYTPTTIRVLKTGQEMGWHFENQFLHCTPGYRHLETIVEPEDHLSYFVVLSAANAGGELVLYDLEWSETEWPDKEHGGTRKNGLVNGQLIASVMEDYDQMFLSPQAGSLVVFDAGRILHRVSAVEGSRRRITVGGFLAFSKEREKLFYWS
ncbi:MAG: 2OG-Fe(II) oxygenase [Nostoc sp. EfeVER01]|uniref:2OG-Fe(II)-dependent halogenase WelO5 family protein n=1 Tax=unclassified Nostoc TaxID=2593658 RepID=UPI002AD4D1E1|nr:MULTISPECIES: 2OG-Fe(II) oxygenase [unclassified Nostoc]MDZ7944016.1 2OG-Fe(II) oxygenase [Nostoc sp. EfeVER01]MDZ7993977.1 2OG-Fe(II) oxygenase [Nostoc sp. EspVER01]